jgi:hypothetical protein
VFSVDTLEQAQELQQLHGRLARDGRYLFVYPVGHEREGQPFGQELAEMSDVAAVFRASFKRMTERIERAELAKRAELEGAARELLDAIRKRARRRTKANKRELESAVAAALGTRERDVLLEALQALAAEVQA